MWTKEEIESLGSAFYRHDAAVTPTFYHFPTDGVTAFSSRSIISKHEINQVHRSLRNHGTEGRSSRRENEQDQSVITYTFEIDKIRRPGARHGRGGRPRALTATELQESIGPQISRKLCRHLIDCCNGSMKSVLSRLKDAIMSLADGESGLLQSVEIPHIDESIFESKVREIFQVKERTGYEIIQCPYLCICFKVPKTDNIDSGSGNCMDRHTTCNWITLNGHVQCSCIGSPTYRILAETIPDRLPEECVHAKGILQFLSVFSASFGVSTHVAGTVISRFIILSSDNPFSAYVESLPKMHIAHKGSVIVVSGSEAPQDPERIMFVPVRHLSRRYIRNICAFCDNVLVSGCHHTRTIALLEKEAEEKGSYATPEFYISPESNTVDTLQGNADNFYNSVSHLPLSPVNCERALRVDDTACNLARAAETFIVKAPLHCPACGIERNEKTRKTWRHGVLMSTVGPCKMETEEFMCSSPTCGEIIMAEGREHCILIDKVTSAATHAFLRRELHGVVISNGTISGRLSHFHSLVTANAFFGIIPADPPCRSLKTLLRLCSVMLRLMCIAPPKSLFRCNNCEFDGVVPREKLKSLCMDGISQGFLKTSATPFQNISEKCVALKSCATARKGRVDSCGRPLISLIRESRPVRILLEAIRGNSILCTKSVEKDFASAVRMVTDCALPASFWSSISVCGKTRGDISNDIGLTSALGNIRKLLTSVFDVNTLLCRLLIPLRDCIHDPVLLQLLQERISTAQSRQASPEPQGLCWNSRIPDTNGGHVRSDIFNLVRIILQGPVLQFVRKSDTTSLELLAELCCDSCLQDLETTLQDPDVLLKKLQSSDTNILHNLKFLRAGVFSATQVERLCGGSNLRRNFGLVLRDCKNIAVRFFAFYDSTSRQESAFQYRNRWDSNDISVLRSRMRHIYGCSKQHSVLLDGNDYELAKRTGAYFPGRPQLRPLPFNDEEVTEQNFESIQTCSKDYLQRQQSFTPGALTFCCSCSNPKILGFKVLYRNEGPRAIIDTVLSRFPVLPDHLIYDFCCGLFISAIHCLWWALSCVYIVCDNFHFKNHSCSPSYSPRAHTELHATNTVSHEQRNRAIARLGLSLRNCRQDLYISLLAYQAIVLNIRAQSRNTPLYKNRGRNLSEYDLEWSYFHCLEMKCVCCT